jgi:hypothetical protein
MSPLRLNPGHAEKKITKLGKPLGSAFLIYSDTTENLSK